MVSHAPSLHTPTPASSPVPAVASPAGRPLSVAQVGLLVPNLAAAERLYRDGLGAAPDPDLRHEIFVGLRLADATVLGRHTALSRAGHGLPEAPPGDGFVADAGADVDHAFSGWLG